MTGSVRHNCLSTRSQPGARRRLRGWPAALLASVLGIAVPAATVHAVLPDGETGPLPWRVGGNLAFTVDAVAIPDSAGGALEVWVRIPPRTLSQLGENEHGESKVKLTLRLKTRYGGKHHDATQELTIADADTGGAYGKVMTQRFPARPGGYLLEVKLEDLRSQKRGIAYVGRKVTKSMRIEGEVKVEPAANEIEVSDPALLWTAGREPGQERNPPNPERLYGLFAPSAQVAFVARAPNGARVAWRWRVRIIDNHMNVLAERDSTADSSAVLRETVAFDISTVPAGAYTLELQVGREGKQAVVRRTTLDIAWQLGSWNRDPDDIADEVHFLFEPKEEEAFQTMGPGAREAAVAQFWRDRDPDPDTGENEARTAYLARVDHANKTWSRMGKVKGMYSDMGRVYIRYGEPDEVLRQVLPAGDQTLMHVLQSLDLTETRPTGEVESKGIGGDQRPFEIWNYDMGINRSLTAARTEVLNEKARRHMVFLFVDEQGYGDYRLRYSTE